MKNFVLMPKEIWNLKKNNCKIVYELHFSFAAFWSKVQQ